MPRRSDRCPLCGAPVPSNRVARFIGDFLSVILALGVAAVLMAAIVRAAIWVMP